MDLGESRGIVGRPKIKRPGPSPPCSAQFGMHHAFRAGLVAGVARLGRNSRQCFQCRGGSPMLAHQSQEGGRPHTP